MLERSTSELASSLSVEFGLLDFRFSAASGRSSSSGGREHHALFLESGSSAQHARTIDKWGLNDIVREGQMISTTGRYTKVDKVAYFFGFVRGRRRTGQSGIWNGRLTSMVSRKSEVLLNGERAGDIEVMNPC